jgi:hypothetical protein
VFAARALKSALFGTPAPPDETTYESEIGADMTAGRDLRKPQSVNMSPTKPPGILLTPGTAATRRKTVSFGTEVAKKDEKDAVEQAGAKLFRNPLAQWPEPSPKSSRKTALTRAMELAREERPGRSITERELGSLVSQPLINLHLGTDGNNGALHVQPRASTSNKSQPTNQQLLQELASGEDFDGDVTMDLNDPRSQSGKFWKSEYENYHEEAKAEMKKLIKYKQLAKSYAKKKDSEAVELAEKLKDEQRRVLHMEDKLSKLSGQIAMAGREGIDESSVLVKELARQTALALQFKAQVEECREALKALEGNTGQSSNNDGNRDNSPRTEILALQAHEAPRKLAKQTKELAALREELQNLLHTVSTFEKSNAKLQEANTILKQELLHADLRLEKQAEKSEKRHQASEVQLQRRQDLYESLQKDYDALKENAKTQRRDAEHLLKKRHDQIVGYKRELASLKGLESRTKELEEALEKKSTEHEKVTINYEKQISRLKDHLAQFSSGRIITEDSQPVACEHQEDKAVLQELLGKSLQSPSASNARDSHIPALSQSIFRSSNSLTPSKHLRPKTPDGPHVARTSSALSEITNNACSERRTQRAHSIGYTPLVNRFSNLSLEKRPGMELPSAELSLPQMVGHTLHERECQTGPHPSIPSKPAIVWSRNPDELSIERPASDLAGRRQAYGASNRLSSLERSRARSTLPPERAAAAKARLEQKNAEKKRAQVMDVETENLPN